ncbi:Retrovirus-related Pol polyprotein from transposon TNT 1-94 [Vitis vinifera]|uniref:Retrovirus-related Pol polyprotein from transposon TNT 1-94 n=1 Tax=Vitis vinifera TaxID=29760 RepID=A0A438HHH5_VITVI|nr:Retrovirus-related Pol polyprotein from transposon TNT 1-94 [Vitis vinifera]
MAEEVGKTSRIEKFDGTDFAYWRMQIEDYLYGRKLHLPLLGTKPKSMKDKTTSDLMKALSGMYEKPSANNKVHLMKKLFNLKMVKNASVTQHLNEFNTITNQLSSVEIDFDDEIRALVVLASLPNSWEATKMAVSNSMGKEKFKYNDIRDLILVEEIRQRDAGETLGSGFALSLETRGREEVQDALLLAVDNPLDDWVLDSGVLLYTTPHREIIQNYAAGDFGKVYLANGSVLDVVGLGDVWILLPQWVYLVTGEEHVILFVGGTWKVTKGARVLARGKKTGTLLGHMSEKWMNMLLSKGKLLELKSIDFDMCESCILGKQKKVSFLKTGRTLKAEKLELVHIDLWGFSLVASLRASRYYITFIDDSSRKVWVYFLKNKSDVFETFKKWKAKVETETGLKVKCLRSDNGREYINGGFSEYCATQGIRMEKTILGTPQQNGVTERMNKTLNERARIPIEFKLPEEIWSVNLMQSLKYVFFIGYGDEKFGYRSTIVLDITEIDQKKSEFVNLDELIESTVQNGGEEDKENVNSQVDLSTPVVEVRRSSKNIRPPQHYSPVLNYLLLIDGGEPECYDVALQDENSSKWELAMKDEMDSLLGN